MDVGYGIKDVFKIWDLPAKSKEEFAMNGHGENEKCYGEGQEFALSRTALLCLSVTWHWPPDTALRCAGERAREEAETKVKVRFIYRSLWT